MKLLQKWLALNGAEQWLLLQTLVIMTIIRLLLLTLPHRLQKKVLYKESSTSHKNTDLAKLTLIRTAICRAANHWPAKNPCLVNALTGKQLLKWHGYSFKFYLGVNKEKDKLTAHAWLTSNGLSITGGNNQQQNFAVVSIIQG